MKKDEAPSGVLMILKKKMKERSGSGSSDGSSDESEEGATELAEELISAVNDEDPAAVVEAFKALYMHCQRQEKPDEDDSDEGRY